MSEPEAERIDKPESREATARLHERPQLLARASLELEGIDDDLAGERGRPADTEQVRIRVQPRRRAVQIDVDVAVRVGAQITDDPGGGGGSFSTDHERSAVDERPVGPEIDEAAAQQPARQVVEDIGCAARERAGGVAACGGRGVGEAEDAGRREQLRVVAEQHRATHRAAVVHRDPPLATVHDGIWTARSDRAAVVDDVVVGAIPKLDAGSAVGLTRRAAVHDAALADADRDVAGCEAAVAIRTDALRPDPDGVAALRIDVRAAGEIDRHLAACAGLGCDARGFCTPRALRHDAVRGSTPGRDVTIAEGDADRSSRAARVPATHERPAEDVDQVGKTNRVDRGVAGDTAATADALRQDSRRAFAEDL